MTPELKRLIQEARARIYGTPLSAEEELDQYRANAIREFTEYLAKRVSITVRFELLLGEFFWNQTAPAARFTVDDRTFLLTQEGTEGSTLLKVGAEEVILTYLSSEDPQFEDHLLLAVGDALER